MNTNDKKPIQEIKRVTSLVSSSSDTVDAVQESIDPSSEIAEPHLLLEENLLAKSLPIPKDNNDSKRVHALLTDKSKKVEEQSRKSEALEIKPKSVHDGIKVNIPSPPVKKIDDSLTFEKQTRRTVTFDHKNKTSLDSLSKRSISSFNQDYVPHDQHKKEHLKTSRSSITALNICNETNIDTRNLEDFVFEDEYLAGGFASLDHELQEELLNDYADEFDDQITRHNRRLPSIRSNDHVPNVTRSPIKLWQRARILLAIHLYQFQSKTLQIHHDSSKTQMINDSTELKSTDDMNEFEKLFTQKKNLDERKITMGLTIIQKLSLNSTEQYRCVDFYDVVQGYIIMCNIDQSDHGKLLVYSIEKTESLKDIHSIEFDCSFQFNFMICIPIFRLIIGFVNIKPQKSLMVLVGDASRKGLFLSKQEIFSEIHSILYIYETAMLFLGCLGRVLLFNTQPLQYNSQPLFLSELKHLPFQSHEPIIHLCPIRTSHSIGILSHRYFLLWEHSPNEKCLLKFCNPYRYDFIRCLYSSKYDYIIFAFFDGLILIYQLNQMKHIRRYQYHWQMITDLKFNQNENLLFSSSIDQSIHIWNLETLQHLYQYNTTEEIYQIDILEENLFFYRTLKTLVFFQLNLHNLLFSLTKSKVILLKLFTHTNQTSRILALLDDYSGILISPISGCCLTIVPNLSKNPIKQVLHDISRSHIYSLQFNGEILLYQSDKNPCIAEYRIQTKSNLSKITCMTLINPMHTHLVNIETFQTSKEKSLEKQLIFFGHTNGYISLFQGDLFTMQPILAHQNSILLLETSKASMDKSNILFTDCEVLLSSSLDRLIYLWDLTMNSTDQSIELIHLLTIEQEKNISMENIQYLMMIDNFIVANYSNQKCLHIWQLLNISIRINDRDQWGIVEHPTKGSHHQTQIQAITATSKLKLFASSDMDGCIKIWDNTNSLIRELVLDSSLCAIEFLSFNGELIFSYQNNLHLILPEQYLLNSKKISSISQIIAEDKQLEIDQFVHLSYQSLPIFEYHMKTHHFKQRLQRFERQLGGRYVLSESDDSESENEKSSSTILDQSSTVSDDPAWIDLAEDVKDILRMKKIELQQNIYK